MNITDDKNNSKKYIFHIGDLLGNILFILKLNDIKTNEITIDLLEKYTCILAEKYAENQIKAEFIVTQEEITRFIESNSDIYKRSEDDDKKIILLKELTAVDLAQRHHNAMPFIILNATLSGEVQSKVIDAYNESVNNKVLQKTK